MRGLTLSPDFPRMPGSSLLLALTGWVDGGLVSSGTVKHLMQGRDLARVARIAPSGYYIDNFPGSIETIAMIRPYVKYSGGVIETFEMPENDFYADPPANIAFFLGKEPNLDWPGFADCVFEVASKLGVTRIFFMGSLGGAVPHTREPKLFGSVSQRSLVRLLKKHGLRPNDYEGPASFATYLLSRSPRYHIEMLTIFAEIPGYLHGLNPLSIEAVTRRMGRILDVPVNLANLREASNAWEAHVTEAIQKDPELAETVRKMEEEYDNELIGLGESSIDE